MTRKSAETSAEEALASEQSAAISMMQQVGTATSNETG
jgi:hypothetical protein